MAEAGTLCINADVEKLAGANASSTADAEAYTNVYIKMVEGHICTRAKYDFVTNYSSISPIGKEFLRQLTAAYSAVMVLNYNMAGYTSRTEAQTMLDVCYSIVSEGMNLIDDDNFVEFIKDGTK